MVLREQAISHNLALMAAYCADRGVDLAPHGKTTMAPQLWNMQLAAGAWGITAATVQQARVMRACRVPRILIANELADEGTIAWVAAQLDDPEVELHCQVDSADGVALLDDVVHRFGSSRSLGVLVELGHEGGRTGCRTVDDALDVAARVRRARSLRLAGVTAYEGSLGHGRSAERLASVARFLDGVRALAERLLGEGDVEGDEMLLSAGGSAFFDVVVERFSPPWPSGARVKVLLRSGCYLTHDAGLYERDSPFSSEPEASRRFHDAIEVFGVVLSRPEPDLAIVGVGRRDVPYDQDLPIPRTVRRASGGGEPVAAEGRVQVVQLNDQHAFCRVGPGLRLDVGDLVSFGVSHPCTAFDKWRVIPMLDADDQVGDAVATFF
jgi:D-serine deaminase-like pyridoxal phosphate-dependent protein